jgi:hypothetical protein
VSLFLSRSLFPLPSSPLLRTLFILLCFLYDCTDCLKVPITIIQFMPRMKLSVLVFVVTCACVWSVCSSGRKKFSLSSFLSYDPKYTASRGDSGRMYDRSSDQSYQDRMEVQDLSDERDMNPPRRRYREEGGRRRGGARTERFG